MAQSQKATRHAHGRTAPQKRSRLPLFTIGFALVALIVGAIVVSNLSQPEIAVTPFTARTINAPTGTTPEGYAYKGRPDAPVTVIEYGDFQCPACANYATQFEEQIDKQFVETGKIRFIYQDFPLPNHQYSVIAATAVRAAGEQGKYWAMHDLLFERQRAWSNSNNIKALLGSYAEAIGLDRQAFDQVLNSDKYTEALETAQRVGAERGVQATPTFEVDGKLVGTAELVTAIETALQAKGQ